MHESERRNVILSAVQGRPVAMIADLCALTGASEATIRRDIAALHLEGLLRRVRGGAEAIAPPSLAGLAGRPFAVNEALNIAQKRAIAREAVKLCHDGEAIIINGGITTFQMAHLLAARRMQILTNSFPIAEYLLKQSQNAVMVPGGMIYREQNIILSPFEQDAAQNFHARRMFMGAHGLGPLGIMEADPLVIQAEQRLMRQADELVVLADSSKFHVRSSLLLCPLARIHTLITDDGLEDAARRMLEEAGLRLVITETAAAQGKAATPGGHS